MFAADNAPLAWVRAQVRELAAAPASCQPNCCLVRAVMARLKAFLPKMADSLDQVEGKKPSADPVEIEQVLGGAEPDEADSAAGGSTAESATECAEASEESDKGQHVEMVMSKILRHSFRGRLH